MGIRVLVVEDEDEIADFLVRGLREEGFTVERSADGHDGWHRLSTESWDAILLDWWLPGVDGLTLLERFRQAGKTTPILFLTARDAISDRVRGLDGGADDYLCKPFAFEELLARVRALVRRPDRQAMTILTHADVTIDLATQQVQRAGRRLDLTAREYALLVLFCGTLARCCPAPAFTNRCGTSDTTGYRTHSKFTSWNSERSSKPTVAGSCRPCEAGATSSASGLGEK